MRATTDTPKNDFTARATIVLLCIVLLGIAGWKFLQNRISDHQQLSASWSDNGIHVFSVRDGPWYVTHLVVYQSSGAWRAVAQLPSPITIIDSSGHHFSREEIEVLEWLDIAGNKQPAPTTDQEVGVMYLEPKEGKRPPRL